MGESSRTQSLSDIRWRIVAGAAAIGATTIGAGAFADDYLADGLLSIGTAVLLFGFIYVAEQRLVATVSEPRTLAEAQRALADALSSARMRGGGSGMPGATAQALQQAVLRVGTQLREAGLRQQRTPDGSKRMVFEDEAGLGVRWVVVWDDTGLRHEVWVHAPEADRLLPARNARVLGASGLTERDHRLLLDFEAEVVDLLRQLLRALRGR